MRQAKPKVGSTPDKSKPAATGTPRRASIGARRNPESAQAILDAAEAILQERGAGGFSIEAVARRAGAGKPTIYRWWPNKAALLLEIYTRSKLELARNDTGSLESDLQGVIADVFHFWATTAAGQVLRSIIAEAQTDQGSLEALRSFVEERAADLVAIFERACARHELAANANPHVLAELVVGYLWERLLLDRLSTDPDEIAGVVRHIAQRYAGLSVQDGALRPGRMPQAQ